MGHVQMLDRAVPPPPETCLGMAHSLGEGAAWAVYVGGAGADNLWPRSLVAWLLFQGVRVLPIYVPDQRAFSVENRILASNDAMDAMRCLSAAYGLREVRALAVDVEAGPGAKDPARTATYMNWFDDMIAKFGTRTAAYSSPENLVSLSQHEDLAEEPFAAWAAAWPGYGGPEELDPHRVPGLPDGLWAAEGQRAWQYASCTYEGWAVDLSVIDEELLTSA